MGSTAQKSSSDQNLVEGMPSKELFITMLTRDLSLINAISDLVDNSVDGAINLKGKDKCTGAEVRIIFEEDSFKIKDNCGGIEKDVAQHYAFRFGRPPEATPINYSVGIFGIGMKRALFKMGKKFEIKSVSEKSSFLIEIDVDKWSKDKEWDFKFKKIEEGKFSLKERGTEITVTSLNPDVKERFKQSNFRSELKKELELQHLMHVSRGLSIKINHHAIESSKLQLLSGDKFSTAFWQKTFKNHGNANVKIYAGIGERSLELGGWYIFCNNRLIKGPEQTYVSGWGAKSPTRIPEYHGQFSRFRGIVLFESKEPSFLPWNTSKTNVDTDSQLFQSVKLEMINLMRPVIDFLNEIHNESKEYHNQRLDEKHLQNQIDGAPLKSYIDAKTSVSFKFPKSKQKPKADNEVVIKYSKHENYVEKLKAFFKVSSPKQVGEKTFDYVYSRECKE